MTDTTRYGKAEAMAWDRMHPRLTHHGPVRPKCHVEALVLDPCYRGTAVEVAALRLGCPVEWHPGFRLRGRGTPPPRTKVTKGAGSRAAALAMVFKLVESAQARCGP